MQALKRLEGATLWVSDSEWLKIQEVVMFKVIFGNHNSMWASAHELGDFAVEYSTAKEAVEAASSPCKGGTAIVMGRFIGPAWHSGSNTPQPGRWWGLTPAGEWADF